MRVLNKLLRVLCMVLAGLCALPAYGAQHSSIDADELRRIEQLSSWTSEYYRQGKYQSAILPAEQILRILENAFGQGHASTAATLSFLADLYEKTGQYNKALPFAKRAMELLSESLGPTHEDTAKSIHSLASLYQTLGQYDKALSLHQRALDIRLKVLGLKHEVTAASLNDLAVLYGKLGQYDKALLSHQHAAEIMEEVLGPKHVDTAKSISFLAAAYEKLGQHDKALQFAKRALGIKEEILGSNHESIAASLNILGDVYQSLGQNDKALSSYQRAVAIYEKELGPDHEDTALTLNSLAILQGNQRKPDEALALFIRAHRASDRIIAQIFPFLTEQEKLKFMDKQEGGYFGMLSLIHRQLPNDQEAIRAGLNLILSRKGIVFDAQARQQEAIVNSLDPETKGLWDELASQRAQFAKLMQNKPEKMGAEDYQARLGELRGAIDRLEERIAGKSALVAEDVKQRKVASREVAQALGKEAVLAEFVKIRDYDWEKKQWSGTWRYLAFVLHGDGSTHMIDLGAAAALEQTVQSALKPIGKLGSDNQQQQDATRTLYQQLWQPIVAAVGDASKVVFSPDGILNLVPFAAMQNADGHYLIESHQISYVTTGRDLTKNNLGIKPQSELYLAANPQFDLVAQANPALASTDYTRGAVRSAGFSLRFAPLPGTAKEAEQIPGYLSGTKIVLTGEEATEESVLNIKRPRVMHLSTHGFFLADQVALNQGARAAVRIKGSAQPSLDDAPALPKGYENPLVRSGLAFAGANHAEEAKSGRDGLLTALEVSGMDLHGTDLVTLSACETGRGEVKSGEGVFGLRRAFALAGARHLMMSLWPVSDAVTARQMRSFYQLYGQHTAPAAALRQAQLATIADLRNRKGQAEPALWAPFIVQGW